MAIGIGVYYAYGRRHSRFSARGAAEREQAGKLPGGS
jgi:hypothetical protein